MSHTTRITNCVTLSALTIITAAGKAEDTKPAKFPDKAYAILVQGSVEGRFKNDVNKFETLLTHTDNRWEYGASSVNKLLWGGSGDAAATWDNVGKALDAAGKNLWSKPAAEQNLVYVHSSHGLDIDSKNSKMSFGNDGNDHNDYRTSDQFVSQIISKFPDGNQNFSLNGNTETTCARSFTFMLEPCFSGGQIWDLTETLVTKENRRKYFPFLSDVTVMTAGDSNECTTANADDTGNSFLQSFYGYTHGSDGAITGALQGEDARSAWAVFKDAAQKTDVNPENTNYTPNSNFGSGNNKTMYVKGTMYDGGGENDYPLYRHVQFYPAMTFGDGAEGRVNLGAGDSSLDFRLGAAQAPLAGALPITVDITGATAAGTINADRDRRPDQGTAGLEDDELFLDYYSFDLKLNDGITFSEATLVLDIEVDDWMFDYRPSMMNLYQWDEDEGWTDSGAIFNAHTSAFYAFELSSLGTFAVVVPTPASICLLGVSCLMFGSRRRFN